ncbi:MAG: transcription termination/antitermination protein NusG [Nitrospinota bacterium]
MTEEPTRPETAQGEDAAPAVSDSSPPEPEVAEAETASASAARPATEAEAADSPAPEMEEVGAAAPETEEVGTAVQEVEAGADHPEMKWYVIHTYSGYEAKVKAALEERLQASPLSELLGKILVPTEDVVEVRGGRRRVSSRKYYPGYILIQMVMTTDTWYFIKNTPKVTGFLGGTNDPTPLGEEDVRKILGQMRGEQVARPKVELEEGESVRVIDGPFANFSGVVETVNHERGKVKIMVTIFGRPTPVELEFLQVERI